MERPKLCGNCGKLMGLEPVCPFCGTPRNDVRQLKGKLRALSLNLSVTHVLLYSMIFVYVFPMLLALFITGSFDIVISSLTQGPPYHAFFGEKIFSGPFLREGYWMGLFTANFLHMGILHIFFNGYTLFVIGPQLEHEVGPWDFWVIYMLSGIGGFAVSALAGNLSGGASAAIFGLIGAQMALAYQRGSGFQDPVFQSLLRWVFIMLLLGFLIPYIDNYAHIGGMVFGGLVASTLAQFQYQAWWKSARKFLSVGFVVVVLYGFLVPLSQRLSSFF